MKRFEPLSLYFHIPFCKRKCDYCHFFVLPNKNSYHKQFFESLKKEWSLYEPLLSKHAIHSVYFGGGTPSLLPSPYLKEILSLISPHNVEITLEANPNGLTKEQLQNWKAMGINRLSLGVQSFDDEQLRILTREHKGTEAIQVIKMASNCGFDNISIDLMYDLPHQTLSSWKKQLDQALDLPITHLSLYNLTIEPHTIYHKYRNKLKPHLPTEEASSQMYQLAVEKFSSKGWRQYEISAFAKGEKISEHNTGYWTGRPFIGLGPSAFSFYEGVRFRNIAHLNRYSQSLEKGDKPVDLYDKIPIDARRRELLAIHLRLVEGCDITAFQQKWGELETETLQTLSTLEQQNFLIQADKTALTEKGRLFYDYIASKLI